MYSLSQQPDGRVKSSWQVMVSLIGYIKQKISIKYAAVGLFAGLFLMVIFTFRDYGIAWDEHLHLQYGKYLVDYYLGLLSGHPDLKATTYSNLYVYGGAYDLFTAILEKLINHFVPIREIEFHHLINGLIGVIGILGAWATARLLAGYKAAFWAAIFLSIIPVYYGHMFFNPKDIPFAVGYIWSLYFLFRVLKNRQKMTWIGILLLGVSIGITSAIRVGGLILIGYFGLGLIWNYWITRPAQSPVNFRDLLIKVLLPAVITLIISWGVMLAFWPWSQQNPIANPFHALFRLSEIEGPSVVLYRGIFFPTNKLPLDYIFGYFAVTLPELLIAMLLIGLVIFIQSLLRQKNIFSSPTFKFVGCILLVLSVLIPPLIAILANTILYDGIRHFLFVIPPLACLAGITFETMLDRISLRRRNLAIVIQGMVGILLIYQVSLLVSLHPYEYIYYNSLVGGTKIASQRYETDYWGTAGSEAAQWLSKYLKENHLGQDRLIKVYYCDDESSVKYYLPKNIKITYDSNRADYFIGGIRYFCNDEFNGEEIFSVTRMGVDLAAIKIPSQIK